MILALDIVAMLSAFAAAYLWFAASTRPLRRVSKTEEIDEADFNRMVVAFNRTQVLNARAALATGISTLAVAFRFIAAFAGIS